MKIFGLWFIAIMLLFGLVVHSKTPMPDLVEEFFYPQPIDHFGTGNLSNIMFGQRYFIDRTHWAGPKSKSPMLVYIEGENLVVPAVQKIGIINEAATRFKALVLYIEHRFYGKSIPFEDIDLALGDREVRGCLTSEQALVDFAEIIQTVKTRPILDENAPVIVFGCSYAGMLVTWLRLKFPHIALGAVASSAPIYYFDMDRVWENVYCEVVSKDFKVVNEKCYERIKQSWDLINKTAAQHDGLTKLEKIFSTCGPLLSTEGLTSSLANMYKFAAQYNGRFNSLINEICAEIVQAPDTDILGGIARAVLASQGKPCIDTDDAENLVRVQGLEQNSTKSWNWQLCSELTIRQGCGEDMMFPQESYNISNHIKYCMITYNVVPRLRWISTLYGSADMQSSLKDFGSNIIFSNGLMDPYSTFGVLEDISDTLVALTTKQGSHCLDFYGAKSDDPNWLKKQRAKEIQIMARWIQKRSYTKDFSAQMKTNSLTLFVSLLLSLFCTLFH